MAEKRDRVNIVKLSANRGLHVNECGNKGQLFTGTETVKHQVANRASAGNELPVNVPQRQRQRGLWKKQVLSTQLDHVTAPHKQPNETTTAPARADIVSPGHSITLVGPGIEYTGARKGRLGDGLFSFCVSFGNADGGKQRGTLGICSSRKCSTSWDTVSSSMGADRTLGNGMARTFEWCSHGPQVLSYGLSSLGMGQVGSS